MTIDLPALKDCAEILGVLSILVGGAYRLGRQDRELRVQSRVIYAMGRRLGVVKRTSVPPPPRGPLPSINVDEER